MFSLSAPRMGAWGKKHKTVTSLTYLRLWTKIPASSFVIPTFTSQAAAESSCVTGSGTEGPRCWGCLGSWKLCPGRLRVQCEGPNPPCVSQSPGENLKNTAARDLPLEILITLTDDGIQAGNPKSPWGSTVQLGSHGRDAETELQDRAVGGSPHPPRGVPGKVFARRTWLSNYR